MSEITKPKRHLGGTVGALTIAFVFYPVTVAGIGTFSNGGVLGLSSLVIASVLAWRSFALNKEFHWIRRLFQLPVTAIVTFMASWDAFCQSMVG
jgi:hypothetical protein